MLAPWQRRSWRIALVMMEVVSDFGTVSFFMVETITLGIFNVWLGMNSRLRRRNYRWLALGLFTPRIRAVCEVTPAFCRDQPSQTSLAPIMPSRWGAVLDDLPLPLGLGSFYRLGFA